MLDSPFAIVARDFARKAKFFARRYVILASLNEFPSTALCILACKIILPASSQESPLPQNSPHLLFFPSVSFQTVPSLCIYVQLSIPFAGTQIYKCPSILQCHTTSILSSSQDMDLMHSSNTKFLSRKDILAWENSPLYLYWKIVQTPC